MRLTRQQQYRKCGKADCHICRDTRGHGPYLYAYCHVNGRLLNVYVGRQNANDEQILAKIEQKYPGIISQVQAQQVLSRPYNPDLTPQQRFLHYRYSALWRAYQEEMSA